MSQPFPILYEDDALLIIDKPPGVVVNRAESVRSETVQDWAERYLRLDELPKEISAQETDFFSRAGIVHRIDKETSGCLVIAKNPHAFSLLQQAFKERTVKKTYVAIVHGAIAPPQGEIRAPVGRLPWNRERFGILPGGKDAITKYTVRSVFKRAQPDSPDDKHRKTEDLSFVELSPETGRTHQIRVHLKYINHPIVGDYLYAGRKTARQDRTWAPRVMLHAQKISFVHPQTHREVAIVAPVPDDMKSIRPQEGRESMPAHSAGGIS